MKKLNSAEQLKVISNGDGNVIKSTEIRKLNSAQLFAGAQEIVIMHFGENYLLTITKQRKLLLTKVKQKYSV